MAPSKFEKHIKKQFEEREIQPSPDAWAKVSEGLDVSIPRPKRKSYFWYGSAASFIGLLIISVVYFGSRSTGGIPEAQVVDTIDEVKEVKVLPNNIMEKGFKGTIVENDKNKSSLARNLKKELGESQIRQLKNQVTSVEEMDSTINKTIRKVEISNDLEDEIINTKVLEIVMAVNSRERNNMVLTEAEVDNLLRNARKEILRDKFFDQNGSVDAMALLTEVEDELDQSFRDKIFESLKVRFLKERTAIADRNK